MKPQIDWLSQWLAMMTVTGQLEIRCAYGAPWRIAYEQATAREIPYHIVLRGKAIVENAEDETLRELHAGDIVMLPHGSSHVLHDGSGLPAPLATLEPGLNLSLSTNTGTGARLDMLCGRFRIAAPYDRLVRDYLPARVVVSATRRDGEGADEDLPSEQLAGLVGLMRAEAAGAGLGGRAMLNALSAALFTLVLRAASDAQQPRQGLLALAGQPRLTPALLAMFSEPDRDWRLPDLAALCKMSRATFIRHFQDHLGRSAFEFLTDVRMGLAANTLKQSSIPTEAVAESVGYQSVAAFRRAFSAWMGMTPGEWRRVSRTEPAGGITADADQPSE
ncbi:cupin domain-containing protein [Paraburkholderia susongensis]|uniref:AraC family transcriptional regulator, activator of mtrCDE n=1 Tax=Paraburkholderia susongensis TaxID=1515439 RepID=A0A1X7IGJ3_9BURK|nr:AraC family transcriptional regulator [Paraburkholderia susongensis]SMG13640.1 AraC family transcriptional regulator, activator of mtrCDE [Paraburkholderia susongensis]